MMLFALISVLIFKIASCTDPLMGGLIMVQLHSDGAIFHKPTVSFGIGLVGSQYAIMTENEARIHNLWPEEKCKKALENKYQNISFETCYFNRDEMKDKFYNLWSYREIMEPRLLRHRVKIVLQHKQVFSNISPINITRSIGIKTTVKDLVSIINAENKDLGINFATKAPCYIGIILPVSSEKSDNSLTHLWGEEQKKSKQRSVELGAETNITIPAESSVFVEYLMEEIQTEIEISVKFSPSGEICGEAKGLPMKRCTEVLQTPMYLKDIIKVTYRNDNRQINIVNN